MSRRVSTSATRLTIPTFISNTGETLRVAKDSPSTLESQATESQVPSGLFSSLRARVLVWILYIVAKTLDIVFASLAVIAVLAFAFIMIRDRIYALVAAWIFSFDAWYLRWSGSGLESSLAVLLVMLTLWYAYRKEYVTASFIVGVLTLVHPAGVLLFVAVLVDAFLNGRGRVAVVRAVVGSFLIYTAVVGSWILYTYVQFGTVIPNVVVSMWGDGTSLSAIWSGFISDLKIISATQFFLAGFLVLGLAVTLWKQESRVLKRGGIPPPLGSLDAAAFSARGRARRVEIAAPGSSGHRSLWRLGNQEARSRLVFYSATRPRDAPDCCGDLSGAESAGLPDAGASAYGES